MLSRKLTGSASFVCLRCRQQLQLARAPQRLSLPPALALSSLRTPLAPGRYVGSYSSRTGAGNPRSGGHDQTNADYHDDPDLEFDPEYNVDTTRHSEGLPDTWLPPARQRNRTFKSRGHFVAPEQEGLSYDILGQPGSAIVLREKGAAKKKRPPPQIEANGASAINPSSFIPEGSLATEEEDILLNIHELRPKDTHIIADRQFDALRDTLVNGFTSAQLKHYIGEYHEMRRLTREDEQEQEARPWVVESQPWAPIVENAARDVEPHLVGYITKGMAPKTRLAVRLMRECWDLSNEAVLDRDGYVSLQLRDVEFSLLTLGGKRWLVGTDRAILRRVKEVRLIRETRMVSIVASKHAADSILERIHGGLANARTSDFSADLVPPKALEPSVLEEVGRITDTVARLDPSGKKVVVTWVRNTERSEDIDNSCETVLRFLHDAYGAKTRVSTALVVAPSVLARGGRYLPVLDHTQKLPWQERRNKWERWNVATPQGVFDDENVGISKKILPFDIDPEASPDGLETLVVRSENLVDSPPGWSAELLTGTHAVFGHAVFAREKQPPSSPVPPSDAVSQLDTSLPRTFIPAIPALGSLNLPNNLYESGLWHMTMVIRFTPSPDTPADVAVTAPDLELRIDADHKEIKALTSLRAIHDTFTGDVCFPAAAVDTRLIQQRYFELPGSSIEHYIPSIPDFLLKSDLRPWDGALFTPYTLPDVSLPRRLLAPSSIDTTSTTTPDTPFDPETTPDPSSNTDTSQTQKINYTLSSLELHRPVAGEHESLKLRYTSIQSSRAQRGSERAELSLEAVRVTEEDLAVAAAMAAAAPESYTDPFDIVDETHFRKQLSSHTLKNPEKMAAVQAAAEAAAKAPRKPVGAKEFLRVVTGIVMERGHLKWHAKRS